MKTKFRAWDAFYKMMIYANDKEFDFVYEFWKEMEQDRKENDCIFMMNTGLKDINGKDIWEGDILKVHIFTQELGSNLGVQEGEKEFKAEICYQEMGLWLQGNTEEESGYILWFNGMHEESFEVIGNIYENKELLSA